MLEINFRDIPIPEKRAIKGILGGEKYQHVSQQGGIKIFMIDNRLADVTDANKDSKIIADKLEEHQIRAKQVKEILVTGLEGTSKHKDLHVHPSKGIEDGKLHYDFRGPRGNGRSRCNEVRYIPPRKIE